MWDLSGKPAMRSIWENYFEDIDGLIYLIDSTDENLEDSVKTLSFPNLN